VLDTVAMAVLAMLVAVATTVVLAPWAARPTRGDVRRHALPLRLPRLALGLLARLLLLVLRAVPPTVWAVIALLALFPGIVPGAVALGLYTGGVLGRLVAEAWEGLDTRPRDALVRTGVGRSVAGLAAVTPASVHQLVTYTLYRFEVCVRDTAVVGVVGAAGLGRLFAEALAGFRFPVVASLLLASLAVSLTVEVVSRRVRRSLRS
jgi:phosphonate transport system permease protein